MKNKFRLKDILLPYKETNYRGFESVSVGKYGIRKRKEIYKKKLSKDESKNKVIFKDTLTIGMGSTQIDFGVLWQNENYSVSPAYHTYKINTQLILSQFLDFYLKYKNKLYSDKYMIHGARQGKKVNVAGLLSEEISLPSKETQLVIVNNLNEINTMIENRLSILNLLEELIESKFKTMFLEKRYGYKPIRYFVQKNILSAKKK
jgi:restriction endonuclease S subunit